jgi:hypothetical protein
MERDSDLVAIPLVVGLIIGVLVVLGAFFFVGAVAGVVALIALVVLAIVLLVRWIRANEIEG